METGPEFGAEHRVCLRHPVQPVAHGIDVKHRASGHDQSLVPLLEESADKFECVLLVIARSVMRIHRHRLDEMMLHGRELRFGRNSCPYRHIHVQLPGIAGDDRGTLFQCP